MISSKATILCILDILQKYSDEEHKISTDKIREKLKVLYNIDMERRTIYRNIDALRSFGIEIEGYTDNREGYCLLDRAFEVSEIRLLSDAIAASDMITPEVSKTMINKLLEKLSVFQGRMMQRTVFVKKRRAVDLSNNSLFYNIDTLNIAINQGCKVCATELYYDSNMKLSPKSTQVIFSPYATIWADFYYYVIGKDDQGEDLTHYRIDYLHDIHLLDRNVDMIFGGINPVQYAEKYIYSKGENTHYYEIACPKGMVEEIAEIFGENATVIKHDYFKTTVKIKSIPSVMKKWILSHCDTCEILSPKQFRDEISNAVMEGYKKYWA